MYQSIGNESGKYKLNCLSLYSTHLQFASHYKETIFDELDKSFLRKPNAKHGGRDALEFYYCFFRD